MTRSFAPALRCLHQLYLREPTHLPRWLVDPLVLHQRHVDHQDIYLGIKLLLPETSTFTNYDLHNLWAAYSWAGHHVRWLAAGPGEQDTDFALYLERVEQDPLLLEEEGRWYRRKLDQWKALQGSATRKEPLEGALWHLQNLPQPLRHSHRLLEDTRSHPEALKRLTKEEHGVLCTLQHLVPELQQATLLDWHDLWAAYSLSGHQVEWLQVDPLTTMVDFRRYLAAAATHPDLLYVEGLWAMQDPRKRHHFA